MSWLSAVPATAIAVLAFTFARTAQIQRTGVHSIRVLGLASSDIGLLFEVGVIDHGVVDVSPTLRMVGIAVENHSTIGAVTQWCLKRNTHHGIAHN